MKERDLDARTAVAAAYQYDFAIIGIVGLPARYGGFETLADHLVRPLSHTRRILVYCSSKASPTLEREYHGATLEYLPWDANGWQSVIYDAIAMLKSAGRCRTLLVLGVSGCLLLPLIRLLAPSARIVTNIDGIEWKRRKWGRVARWILRLSERAAVKFSHVVIADNRGIQSYVMQRYGRLATLIPYGGDTLDVRSTVVQPQTTCRTRFAAGTYFLTVCRIEPENNIEEILQAFEQVPQRQLVIVGNWSISAFASRLRQHYGCLPNIELLDPIYEPHELARIRSEALAYVHGHSAGGTNPSLVEAMHAGLAVFAYDVDYNRHTMASQGWYWAMPQDLARLVCEVDREGIAAAAASLRNYAHQHYTWELVCQSYARVLTER